MIGDQLDRDIRCAGEAGFETFFFPSGFAPYWNRDITHVPDHEIARFDEAVPFILQEQFPSRALTSRSRVTLLTKPRGPSSLPNTNDRTGGYASRAGKALAPVSRKFAFEPACLTLGAAIITLASRHPQPQLLQAHGGSLRPIAADPIHLIRSRGGAGRYPPGADIRMRKCFPAQRRYSGLTAPP